MKAQFVNPYNFIPLGKEKSLYKPKSEDRLFTGEIVYSLMTRMPLFIPDTESVQEDEKVEGHKKYSFFSYSVYDATNNKEEKRPVIPGSEIRGMFRGYFEILSNSCMSALDSDTQLTKWTSEVFKAGLLKKENGKYVLYEAEAFRYMPYQASLQFKEAELMPAGGMAQKEGYLLIGNTGGRKKWSHIISLKKDKKNEPVQVSASVDVGMLEKVLKEYRKNT